MRATLVAAVAAAALGAAPAAMASPVPPPPTDAVHVGGGMGYCDPDMACHYEPFTVEVDKTYPSRLAAWAKDILP